MSTSIWEKIYDVKYAKQQFTENISLVRGEWEGHSKMQTKQIMNKDLFSKRNIKMRRQNM